MNEILENCLFHKNPGRYEQICSVAKEFSREYIGENIICDHIFSTVENFCIKNGFAVKTIRFPMHDDEIWAITTVKKGCVFITINTSIELNKQIFAAAHELYHIYRFINADDDALAAGSVLTARDATDVDIDLEEQEANAFAALILAPLKQVSRQKKIADEKTLSSMKSLIIFFMDCFALPYKAMVIKLFECKLIEKQDAELLMREESSVEKFICEHDGRGSRWFRKTCDNNLEQMKSIVELNKENGYITKVRAEEDLITMNELISQLLQSCKDEV